MTDSERYEEAIVALYLGRRGRGKTYQMRADILKLLSHGRTRVLVHVPRSKFDGGMEFPSVEAYRNAETWPRVAVFRRKVLIPELTALARDLWERGERVVLAFDEFDRACTKNGRFVDDVSDNAAAQGQLGPLREATMEGRHCGPIGQAAIGCDVLGCARRPANLVPDLRAVVTEAKLFRMVDEDDVKWCAGLVGKKVARKVPHLRGHDFIPWHESDEAKDESEPDELDEKEEAI